MIKSVSVKNIALIDSLDFELGGNLNILSGETGAGKSLIIDALNFVLGERADRSLIRYGTDHAVVEALFESYLTPQVERYMETVGIDPEEVLIIRRKMSSDGKNECRINGRPSTLSVLKGLTELLVDIHGQHEHQSLVKPANHEGMLDGMAAHRSPRSKLMSKPCTRSIAPSSRNIPPSATRANAKDGWTCSLFSSKRSRTRVSPKERRRNSSKSASASATPKR